MATPADAPCAFAVMMQMPHHQNMNLARIRQAKGLNQRQLAEMVGLNQSTIARAENAHPTAKLATYQKCADALGVDLSDIFSDDRTPVEIEVLRTFRSISEEKRERMLALLDLVREEARAAP